MNPNQYYGSQSNFMPMQNTQPYYQPPIMSPRAPEPLPPQTNQVPQFSQPMMNQPIPPPQYSQPQYQYGNNQNYPTQNTPNFQPTPQNLMPNQVNLQQPYQSGQPMYPNQNAPNQNYNTFPDPNQYGVNTQGAYNPEQPVQTAYSPGQPVQTVYSPGQPVQTAYSPGQPVQTAYSPPPINEGNFYNPPQVDPQQTSNPVAPNTANPPPVQVEEAPSTSKSEPAQYHEPTHQKVQNYKPTHVVGDYKCSDFPNLFTGPFRYSGSPVQRKPFTMRNEFNRPSSQPNHPSTDRRNSKRWELRGGKYVGCFTSRTNGLQDNCTKARCKMCPTERKK